MTDSEDPNPLQKLIDGFCSPQKITKVPATFDDDAADEANNKYAADLTPLKTKPVEEKKETKKESTPAEPSKPDKTATESESSEDDVSKKVIANRRKRGFENFIMACIFLLATLLTLKKLGFTTSDFGISAVGGDSGSSSWINVVDKASIEESPGDEDISEEEAEDSSTETEAEEL